MEYAGKYITCLMALAMLGVQNLQAAPLEKCVDDKGRVYYGDSIPPDVLAKCRTSSLLSKQGIVKKDTRYMTGEERAAAEAQAAKKAEADKIAEEQKRRDNALLSSYSKEEEIDLARDRSLQATQARIEGIQSNAKSVQGRLDGQLQRVESFRKKNKPVPDDLTMQVSETQSEIKHLNASIARAQKDKAAISARFAEDKKRFRVLKGFDPATDASANQPASASTVR
jgi:chromosome segregation ATPase